MAFSLLLGHKRNSQCQFNGKNGDIGENDKKNEEEGERRNKEGKREVLFKSTNSTTKRTETPLTPTTTTKISVRQQMMQNSNAFVRWRKLNILPLLRQTINTTVHTRRHDCLLQQQTKIHPLTPVLKIC